MEYEVDYSHVINKEINGINVAIYFSKKRNEKVKDMVLDILMDSYEKRMQDYIKSNAQTAQTMV